MNIISFGIGHGNLNIEEICLEREITILGFLQIDKELDINKYNKKIIIKLNEIQNYNYDYLIICEAECLKYYEQLIEYGIESDKILDIVNYKDDCYRKLGYPKYLVRKQYNSGPNDVNYTKFKLIGRHTEEIKNPMNLKEQETIVSELLDAYNKAENEYCNVKSAFNPGDNWREYLKSTRGEFYSSIQENNLTQLTYQLNNFYRNNLSTGILGGEDGFNYFKKGKDISIINQYKSLFRTWEFSIKNKKELSELVTIPIGNPYGYNIDGYIINVNEFMNNYRAEFVKNIIFNVEGLKKGVVAEIGGGYGNFAYHLNKHEDNLTYINFDLIENLMISSYYLKMAFPNKRILLYNENLKNINNEILQQYDIILMPNYMIDKLDDRTVDFFINTISLSEMSYLNIDEYINQIHRTTKKYFYHENLIERNYDFENYPSAIFPTEGKFINIISGPSRWLFFGSQQNGPLFFENLYTRI